MRSVIHRGGGRMLLGFGLAFLLIATLSAARPRVFELTADKDNRFKVPGQKKPVLTVKAKEVIRLRITTRKGTEWEKDGTAHSLTIIGLEDQGWNLRLKEGTQEFTLVAPPEPGEYMIECTVLCGPGHEDMNMKLVVTP